MATTTYTWSSTTGVCRCTGTLCVCDNRPIDRGAGIVFARVDRASNRETAFTARPPRRRKAWRDPYPGRG